MKRKILSLILAASLAVAALTGCGDAEKTASSPKNSSDDNSSVSETAESSETADAPEESAVEASQALSPAEYQKACDLINANAALTPDGAVFVLKKGTIQSVLDTLNAAEQNGLTIEKLYAFYYLTTGREVPLGICSIMNDGSVYTDGKRILEGYQVNDLVKVDSYLVSEDFGNGENNANYFLVALQDGELCLYNARNTLFDPSDDEIHPLGISDVTRIFPCEALNDGGKFFVLQHSDLTYEMFFLDEDCKNKFSVLDPSVLNGAVDISCCYNLSELVTMTYTGPGDWSYEWNENQDALEVQTFVMVGIKPDGTIVGNENVPAEVLGWNNMAGICYTYDFMNDFNLNYANYGFVGITSDRKLVMSGNFPTYTNGYERPDGSSKDDYIIAGMENVLCNTETLYYDGLHYNSSQKPYQLWKGKASSFYQYMRDPDGKWYEQDPRSRDGVWDSKELSSILEK